MMGKFHFISEGYFMSEGHFILRQQYFIECCNMLHFGPELKKHV